MAGEHLTALALQGEILRYWRSPQAKRMSEAYTRYSLERLGSSPEWAEAMGQTYVIEAEKLRTAPSYWVSADMCAMTEHAAMKMALEALEPTDLPTMSGFVCLARPVEFAPYTPPGITGVDVAGWEAGQDIQATAFSWGPAPLPWGGKARSGIHFTAYGQDPALRPFPSSRAQIINQHVWGFGHVELDDDEYAIFHAFAKALWGLCQSRIGRATPGTVDRAARRRAERDGLEPEVMVVDLRRREPSRATADGSPVDWSCRWIVDGHWRNQWYPSLGVHRQRWIDDFEKGPVDKPLRLKDRVYRLRR